MKLLHSLAEAFRRIRRGEPLQSIADMRMSTREPLPTTPPFLWWLWLTVDEWSLLWAVSALFQERQEIRSDISPYGAMAETCWRLQYDYGYEFQGLRWNEEDGQLYPRSDEPLEPRNAVWQTILSRGLVPDYSLRCGEAIEYAMNHEPLRALVLDLEQAKARIAMSVSRIVRQEPDKETKEWLQEQIRVGKEMRQRPEFQQMMSQLGLG